MDPYKILGVNRDATQQEILAAYWRERAKYPLEKLDDDQQSTVQQIDEALATLGIDSAALPLAIPTKSAPAVSASAVSDAASGDHESIIAIDPVDDSASPTGGRRSRRSKTSSVLPTLIGTIGGAVCAAIVGWYVLGQLSPRNEADNLSIQGGESSGDSDASKDHGRNQQSLLERNSNSKTANPSRTKQGQSDNKVDYIGSAINNDNNNQPAADQPFTGRPLSTDDQAGKNLSKLTDRRVKKEPARGLAANTPSTEFWRTIKKYSEAYQAIDREPISSNRHQQLAQWLAEFQAEVNNQTTEIEYAVRDISQIQGAIHDVRFSAILGTGMNLANIQFPRVQRVRARDRDLKNVQRGSTVKFTGRIASTIPAAGMPLRNQPPYMAVFRLTLRGRHEPVTIDFAIQNPKQKFLLPK